VTLLPSFPNLCYHRRSEGMEPRRFESGDPTPGGGPSSPDPRPGLGNSCAPVLEVGLPPGHGEQREFCFLIWSFLIQRRRLANGGATAMSTDPIYDAFDSG
jgi:hypothetical protein